MPTLQNYADDVLNTLSGLLSSDDDRLLNPQIAFWIGTYRQKLFAQYTDFGKNISPDLFQDLGQWELEPVDKAEDPGLIFGQKILRTVNPIPDIIKLPENRAIKINALNKQTAFVWTTAENALYKTANSFAQAAGVIWCYRIGQIVYVLDCTNNNMDLKWINLRAILSDPTQGNYYYSNGNGIAFNINTSVYPLDRAYFDIIKAEIIAKEFNVSRQTYDPTNDASADAPNIPQSKQGESR